MKTSAAFPIRRRPLSLHPAAPLRPTLCPHPRSHPHPHPNPTLTRLALDNLHSVVAHNHALPRMHAAEDLVLLGEPDPLAAIQADLPKLATEPIFRIVLWRIQARQATAAGRSMDPWTRRIVAVFFATPEAPDRVNAAETLGKLGYNPPAAERPDFERLAQGDSLLALHARWVLAGAGDEADEEALAGFLNDRDTKLRGDAAYALRFRPKVRPATRDLLISAPPNANRPAPPPELYLFSSALFHAGMNPEDRSFSGKSDDLGRKRERGGQIRSHECPGPGRGTRTNSTA